LFINVLYLFTE